MTKPTIWRSLILLAAALTMLTLLAKPALADDGESGSLQCPTGQVVWITERTGPGTTTITVSGRARVILKTDWSTSRTRTGLRATTWAVTTTGEMDHDVTGAACGF